MLVKASQKAVACALAIALVALSIPSFAYADVTTGSTFVADGVTYTITSDTEVSVGRQNTAGTDFASESANVVIPSTVNGYTVTAVNDYAFSDGVDGSTTLESITLPNTIKTIGKFAFLSCDKLTSIAIPGSVTSIMCFAFGNCDSLQTVTFEKGTDSLSFGESVFAVSGLVAGGALSEITLPARTLFIPDRAFENQGSLTSVKYEEGSEVAFIGARAFNNCRGLEYLEIPPITNSTNKIGTNALYGLASLSSLVFLGDEDFGLSTSTFTVKTEYVSEDYYTRSFSYSPITQIVYYGTHTSTLYATEDHYANHYQRIAYYESADQAQSAEGKTCGEVFVRDDVLLKDLVSSQGKSDSKGSLVLKGAVPTAPNGKSWFYGTNALNAGASTLIKAYPADKNDLGTGVIFLDKSEAEYLGTPISPVATVWSSEGATLIDGTDYTLTVADESGNIVSSTSFETPGTYTFTASGTGTYTGSVSTTFTLISHAVSVVRCDANGDYGVTGTHMAGSAFASDEASTLIVASSSNAAAAAAAAGLAGTVEAPIVVNDDGDLSMETLLNLNTYNPSSVLLVGFTDGKTIIDQVKKALGANVKVSNSFTADTQALMSYAMYSRTKTAGYWDDSTTAYIASSCDVTGAAIAGTCAYRTASPVFLTETDGTLPLTAATELGNNAFSRIVIVGDAASQSTVVDQLKTAGCTADITTLSGNSAYELSLEATQVLTSASLCGVDNPTFVNEKDTKGLITATTTCGKNMSALVLFDEDKDGKAAISQYLTPNISTVNTVYLFGTRSLISSAYQNEVEKVWTTENALSLKWATAQLTTTTYVYDGNTHNPEIEWVKDAEGNTLTEGVDYRIRYYNSDTDKLCSAANIKNAANYTIEIKGLENSAGKYAYTDSCFLAFSIAPLSLDQSDAVLTKRVYTYTGSAIEPVLVVKHGGITLKKGADYTVSTNEKIIGACKVTVTATGNYTGSVEVSYTIDKAAQSITAKASKTSLKAKTLKKKALKIRIKASAKTAVTFKSSNKKIKVTSKGVVTFKKGTKKGTYKITITAKASTYYKTASKTIKIKVK